MSNRKLASIQRVVDISAIDGADKIEKLVILGWEVVAQKGLHKVDDLVVYIEIDSILPERPEFEFMRERRFRVKTIKLRKQISMGLCFPISILPKGKSYHEGDDVTDLLGITKYESITERSERENVKLHPIVAYLMRFKLLRSLLSKRKKQSWPSWVAKTDEDRIQNCAGKFISRFGQVWDRTEKLDGSSSTYFIHTHLRWFKKVREFGVCSRNVWYKTFTNNCYWNIADKYNLPELFQHLPNDYVIQGEIVGPKIQGNKYGLTENEFYVFNVIENGKRLGAYPSMIICEALGLKRVPQLGPFKIEKCEPMDAVKQLVEMSRGVSKLNSVQREGIVVRLADDQNVSFKVINPDFLLKYDE